MKLFLAFFLAIIYLRAQNLQPYYYKINQAETFKETTIYSLLQDEKGAVFIGHENGLTKFNGKTFYTYSLQGKSRTVGNLLCSNDRRCFGKNFNGDVFCIKDDSVSLPPLNTERMKAIPVLWKTDNDVLLSNDNVLLSIKSQMPDTIHQFPPNQKILYVLKDSTHVFWVLNSSNDGYSLVHKFYKNKLVKTILVPVIITNRKQLIKINDTIYVFFIENAGFYPLLEKEAVTKKMKLNVDIANIKIIDIVKLNQDLFGITSYNGIYIFDSQGALKKHLLKGMQVSAAMQDKEGSLWIGTLQEGLFVFPSLDIEDLELEGVLERNENISQVCRTNTNSFLLGTYHGRVLKLDAEGKVKSQVQLPGISEVQSFFYDRNKDLIYVYSDALYVINNVSFDIVKSYSATSTKDIYAYGDKVYCATSKGFISIDANGKSTAVLRDIWVNKIAITGDSAFLLATRNGLFRFNLLTHKIDEVSIQGEKNVTIRWVEKGLENDVIVITADKGILKYKEGKLMNLQLPAIYSKVRTIDNHYCFINSSTIDFYKQNAKRLFYSLNPTKGMLSNGVIDFFKHGNKYILTGSKTLRFVSRFMEPNKIKPFIRLKQFTGSYRYVEERYVSDFERNNLRFTIEALPNIRSLGTATMKYRFLGLDDDWTTVDGSQNNFEFKYQLLPPGEYDFEAIVINEDGISSNPLKMQFVVLTPFWRSEVFIISIIIVVLFIFYYLYKWRINVVNNKAREKVEKERTKNRVLSAELTAIRSQMNPHFIFNSLSSIQAKVLSADKKGAYKDISTFSKLMRSVLELSGKEFILLKDEIEFINDYLYLEGVRFERTINFKLEVANSVDVHFLQLPTLITQPFIENAFKHGLLHQVGKKEILISFNYQNNQLEILISDNGIGREKSKMLNQLKNTGHKSFATEAINKRINHINNSGRMFITLTITDKSVGTDVKIIVNYLTK